MFCTGLLRLERRGHARVSFIRSGSTQSDERNLELQVNKDGLSRRIFVDLVMRSDEFAHDRLEDCDMYLKRSFYSPDVHSLPVEVREKVLPFGLNYACQGRGLRSRILRALGPYQVRVWARQGLRDPRKVKRDLSDWNGFLGGALPDIAELERGPDAPARQIVFFQRQLWRPDDGTDAVEENERRIAITRALRNNLGDRFWGGIRPTLYALNDYPEDISREISRLPSAGRRFVSVMGSALIGVCTPGLYNSTSFILGEYMASSKVIVADGFRHELPIPLRDGKHYRHFRDPDECARICAELLDDADQVARMRWAAHRYYRENVEPAAQVLQCLKRAFD